MGEGRNRGGCGLFFWAPAPSGRQGHRYPGCMRVPMPTWIPTRGGLTKTRRMPAHARYKPRITGPDEDTPPPPPEPLLDKPLERKRTARNSPPKGQVSPVIVVCWIIIGIYLVGAVLDFWNGK